MTSDDIYKGYYIPKDSPVLANVWKFLQDPKVYSNPEKDPREVCFGFDRGVCPGSVLAQASSSITAAMSLGVLGVSEVDGDGKVIAPVVRHADTMLR